MMNFIYGVLITWFLLGIGYSMWWGENNFYDLLMELPAQIVTTIITVICFPFIWFYCVFLRHTINPVNPAVLNVQKIIKDSHKIYGNLYFCHDKKARALRNKIFFFRVDSKIPDPTKPSVPNGNFRIGS